MNAADAAARFGSTEATVRDVIAALSDPFHDPRDSRTPPVLKRRMLRLEDLTPGMELKGTVVNVVPFGAFVDIGLKDTGLVHISRMANKFIKNPYEVVGVGDVVSRLGGRGGQGPQAGVADDGRPGSGAEAASRGRRSRPRRRRRADRARNDRDRPAAAAADAPARPDRRRRRASRRTAPPSSRSHRLTVTAARRLTGRSSPAASRPPPQEAGASRSRSPSCRPTR